MPERPSNYLSERFGLNPAGTLAAVSPSLGPCCAEFVNYRREIPEKFWSFQVRPEYFDFWAITRDQLTSAGICEENIEFSAKMHRVREGGVFFVPGRRPNGAHGVGNRLEKLMAWVDSGLGAEKRCLDRIYRIGNA